MSRRCLCAVAFGVAVSACLHGDMPNAADGVMTISQAIDEALDRNLALLAARTSLSVAAAAAVTARLRPNPVLSFSADHLDLLGTHFDATNNGGPPEIAWRVDVPIERGGKREARIGVAAAVQSAAEAQFADAVRVLRQDVTLACIDVIAAKAARALVRDNLRAFEDLARVNDARVAAGSIAPFESTRSRVAMLQFRATVVRADLDLAAATDRLRTLLGRPPNAPLDISDGLSSPRSTQVEDEAQLQRLAVVNRPDLAALQLAEARSTADLRLQEALGKIDYTVGAEYRRQQGIGGRSNSLGVFISAPLPLSNRNQGEIARAGAERDQAARLIAARRAQIAAEVKTARHEYEATRELVKGIERDLLHPASSARDVANYTYRAGASTLLELLDAQRAFNDTMQSYLDAQTSLRRAASHLNAAVGMEVVP